MIVDYNNKRVRELVHGKTSGGLKAALEYIPGRENVKNVTLDLSDTYKSFVKDFVQTERQTSRNKGPLKAKSISEFDLSNY